MTSFIFLFPRFHFRRSSWNVLRRIRRLSQKYVEHNRFYKKFTLHSCPSSENCSISRTKFWNFTKSRYGIFEKRRMGSIRFSTGCWRFVRSSKCFQVKFLSNSKYFNQINSYFSALKLVHLFSINPHLGPLQISLGRMVIDIVKFFFIYSLVLFAFACGNF